METIEPVLDRDTGGLPGSPAIAESILAKISMADIFVGDVSIISSGPGARPTPNPNVLIELGYAVAQLGWDRVLLVQNAAFGSVETLPFDLRGRRVVVYEAPDVEQINKAEIRGLLQGRLEEGLRQALGVDVYGNPSGPDAGLWWGKWRFGGGEETSGGELFVREIGSEGFLFDLIVFNGAHRGTLTSFARLVSKDLAYSRVPNGEEFGELVFRRVATEPLRVIELAETASCHHHRGALAYFGGKFVKVGEPWFDMGWMNELELSRLYSITGEYYDKLKRCTQNVQIGENLDQYVARVLTGGVPGLYTAMESIVMIGSQGELWAAFIDDDEVRYFTNQPNSKTVLPATFDTWRANFIDKNVVFNSEINLTPPIM